jgi:histidinol-phosphate aminotransferase
MLTRDCMRSTTRDFQQYYNPKVGNCVRMDTNTNPLGSNPAAVAWLKSESLDLDGYPNPYSDNLRTALGELYGLERDNFVVGSGSDEMLDLTFKTFAEMDGLSAIPYPSYVLYDYFIKMNGGRTEMVELTPDFQLDVDGLVRTGAKIHLAPSPNNPTGNCFRQKDVEDLLSRAKGIVVIDEAYGEFAEHSMIPRVNEFDNLIVMRTFSKAYAMAALRVGYAVSNKNVAGMMQCVKIPYSLNKLSEGAAMAALKDQDFVRRSVAIVKEQRPKLSAGMKKLGFEVFPSDSNFIMARSPIDHAALVSGLQKKGVLIRDFGNRRRTENCVRPAVGTAEMNRMLLEKMAEVIDECR